MQANQPDPREMPVEQPKTDPAPPAAPAPSMPKPTKPVAEKAPDEKKEEVAESNGDDKKLEDDNA